MSLARSLPMAKMQRMMTAISCKGEHAFGIKIMHESWGVPVGNSIEALQLMTRERMKMRLTIMLEEFLETVHAAGFSVSQLLTIEDVEGPGFRIDPVEFYDGLGDILVTTLGTALEGGGDIDRVMCEILCSNLTKLQNDGNPLLRADGKVLKSENYVKPDIANALGLKGANHG